MGGFDPNARAILDSFYIAGSTTSSTNDYALLQAVVGEDLKVVASNEKSDSAKGAIVAGQGWTRNSRSTQLSVADNRCHFLWITHCLAHLCGLSVHREAIFRCYGGLFADFVTMAMICVTQMHEEDVVRWADILELPEVPGRHHGDHYDSDRVCRAGNLPVPDTSDYLDPTSSLPADVLDGNLHAGEAAILRSFDELSRQSSFNFSAFLGLMSLSVRCCGSNDGHYVHTFDNTAASVNPGLSNVRPSNQNNSASDMIYMSCGALPAQPWSPTLSEDLFGLSLLPRSDYEDCQGEEEDCASDIQSGESTEKKGSLDSASPIKHAKSKQKTKASSSISQNGSYLTFLKEFGSAGLVYALFNMLRKQSPLAKLLLSGRSTLKSLRKDAKTALNSPNSTVNLDYNNNIAPEKAVCWSSQALDAIEARISNTYASILLIQTESLVAIRQLTALDGDNTCQQIESCGGAYLIAALSALPSGMDTSPGGRGREALARPPGLGHAGVAYSQAVDSPSLEKTSKYTDRSKLRHSAREELLLVSRVHNSLALIMSITRASNSQSSTKAQPQSDESPCVPTEPVIESVGMNTNQCLLKEYTELFFAFLEALPSYLVWLQGASALRHALRHRRVQ